MIKIAKSVIRSEINALEILIDAIDENFEKVVSAIKNCSGRVVITGVGKSGHIGKKIAASLASLGTPAFFVHATEAAHGDLGMITENDIVIAISNSGRTHETINLIEPIRKIGAKLIAITKNENSILAENADLILKLGESGEADPLGLAPTNSAIATLALGDAIAIALSISKNFTRENFAKFHPGGSLGKIARGE